MGQRFPLKGRKCPVRMLFPGHVYTTTKQNGQNPVQFVSFQKTIVHEINAF